MEATKPRVRVWVAKHWYQFKTVEGLVQMTDMVGEPDRHTKGLLAKHRFVKIAMKESILDVMFVDGPRMGNDDAEDTPYRGGFENRTESLIIVDALLLRKSSNDPAGLCSEPESRPNRIYA